MNGCERIAQAFASACREQRAALMPYFTLGYPDRETSISIAAALAASGADLIELGVPFSDPLADGPTIQRSTQVALESGITVADCLGMVQELRARGLTLPLLLMGYYNPLLAYGVERFAADARGCGADGLIVPDLPLEEAAGLESAAAENGLALVYLAAPTTPEERLAQLAAHSTGFIYIVSLTGVTGARRDLSAGLATLLERVRAVTDKPRAVGFGISTPEQAARVGRLAEGVIVGSALIDVVSRAQSPAKDAGEFVAAMRQALEGSKKK